MDENKRCWGLVQRRQCLVPTWRGVLVLLLCFFFSALILLRATHPFLAMNAPLPGGVLVVEGWAPDYVLAEAIIEFNRNHYDQIMTTGIPIEHGGPLSEYKTYAELGAAVLLKLGLDSNVVVAVPTPDVRQDRTYTSAVALRSWLKAHGKMPTRLTVFSAGPHARRSRLLYQKAFGKEVAIGIISIPEHEYDPAHWWRSSAGVRTVLGEVIAYVYAKTLFHAPKPDPG